MTERDMGRLELSVTTDLERWGGEVQGTALAASALDLARRLDAEDVRPAAASMLHAQLRATLLDLGKLAPAAPMQDGVSDLAAERAARRKAAGMQ